MGVGNECLYDHSANRFILFDIKGQSLSVGIFVLQTAHEIYMQELIPGQSAQNVRTRVTTLPPSDTQSFSAVAFTYSCWQSWLPSASLLFLCGGRLALQIVSE